MCVRSTTLLHIPDVQQLPWRHAGGLALCGHGFLQQLDDPVSHFVVFREVCVQVAFGLSSQSVCSVGVCACVCLCVTLESYGLEVGVFQYSKGASDHCLTKWTC